MQDADALSVRESVALPLNLEMGNTPEMVDFALRLKPDYVCMVPEKREEITTEGGLDAVFHEKELAPTMARMADNGIQVSLFIDPELAQVDAAARLGAPMVELHTGCFANHAGKERTAELARLKRAAELAGQIVVQTFPLIGNYGVIPEDFESECPHVKAYIVRDWCQEPSNFRCEGDLDTFLKQHNIVGTKDSSPQISCAHDR